MLVIAQVGELGIIKKMASFTCQSLGKCDHTLYDSFQEYSYRAIALELNDNVSLVVVFARSC